MTELISVTGRQLQQELEAKLPQMRKDFPKIDVEDLHPGNNFTHIIGNGLGPLQTRVEDWLMNDSYMEQYPPDLTFEEAEALRDLFVSELGLPEDVIQLPWEKNMEQYLSKLLRLAEKNNFKIDPKKLEYLYKYRKNMKQADNA